MGNVNDNIRHRGYRVRYQKLGRRKAVGLCDWDNKEILIDERQTARNKLDTIVHEHLHRMHPDWSEKQVAKEATDLASALWKMGYRMVELS